METNHAAKIKVRDFSFYYGEFRALHGLTLDIYEREGLFEKAAALAPYFLDAVFSLSDLPVVTDIRGYGLLAGIDLAPLDGKPGARGYDATKRLFNAGMHIKFTGDAGIVAPPLVAEKRHIDEIVARLRDVLARY